LIPETSSPGIHRTTSGFPASNTGRPVLHRDSDPVPRIECRAPGPRWLRLLRREVEALVKKKHGDHYLKEQRAKTELARVNRQLKRLKGQIAALEERKSKLIAELGR